MTSVKDELILEDLPSPELNDAKLGEVHYPGADYEADRPPDEYVAVSPSQQIDYSSSSHIQSNCLSSVWTKLQEYWIARLIGGFMFIFFFLYEVLIVYFPYQDYMALKNSGETTITVPTFVPAMHWTWTVLILLTSLTIFFAGDLMDLHEGFVFMIVALPILSILFWIAYSLTSLANIFDYSSSTISRSTIQNKIENIDTIQPYYDIYATGKAYNATGHFKANCYSRHYQITAESHVDSSTFPEIPSNPVLFAIDYSYSVNKDDESWARARADDITSVLPYRVKTIPMWYVKKWNPVVNIEMPGLQQRQMITPNGKLPGSISKGVKYSLIIFWAPAAYIYRLASYPVRHAQIVKSNIDFDTTNAVFWKDDFAKGYKC